MMRAIHRRADKVVHRGIDDQEIPALAVFHINDFGDKDTGIARNQPTGLNLDLAAQITHGALDQRAVIGGQGRGFV